jgi:amino acid adenylation domain-containing protein
MSHAVHQLFSAVAGRHASRPAVERAGRRTTYGELEARSNGLAHRLVEAGLTIGDVVALMARDPAEVVAGILGVLKAGGVFMPLDPAFPVPRLRLMAGRVEPRWAVAGDGLGERAAEVLGPAVRTLRLDAAARDDEPPAVSTGPESPCSVYFTSGSTGRPKAILGRLKGIAHFVQWEAELLEVGPGTRVSQLASPAFDGFLKDVFVPLLAGGVACAPESRDVVLDAARLVDWLDVEGVEVLHCVPSVLRAMLHEPLDPQYFGDMRWAVLAGEVLQRADVRRWREVFGDRIRLLNLYGPTETTVTKLFHVVEAADVERSSIPIGRPMPGAAALVLDARDRPCGVGDAGEIVLRTPYRSLGYYGEPDLTRRAFVPNPFSQDADDLVYRTGDYGRLLEDGAFEFLGRRDQQVQVRGVRAELGEIEGWLLEHPAVEEAAVVDRADGDGSTTLCAYVVPAAGTDSEALAAALRPFLGEQLPAALVPSAFIAMAELPRTLGGKIDRRALPTLEQVREQRGGGAEAAPRTPVEEVLAAIWSEVLRLPRVGRDDHFFDLGGHSLLATQVILRLRQALGVEVSLRSLFEAPTVRGLAAVVERARRDGAPDLEPIRAAERNGAVPLSYPQQRMWLLEKLSAGSGAFNLAVGMRVRGPLDLGALARTFGEVVRRHEVLRTTFPLRDEAPVQVVAPPWQPALPRCDLSGLERSRGEAEARRVAAADARRSFDLAAGPLLRLRVLRLAPDEHAITCSMHHLVGDAWSFGVLTSEVGRLYDCFRRRQPSPLAELPIQYADYALWQRRWLAGEVLDGRLAYWRRQLAGAPERLSLPQDRNRAALQSFHGRRLPVELLPPLAAALRALGRREGTSLYMTALAGFLALLSQYTGQRDLVVGSVIANRERAEVAKLIGFFANTLVLRVDLGDEATYAGLLRRVRETCLGAYAHQVPPEKLAAALPGRATMGDRLFDVWFQMESAPRETLELSGLEWEPWEVERRSTRFELSLVLEEDGDGIRGEMEYDATLFDPALVRQMRQDLGAVFEEMTRDPEQRI